MCMYDRARKTFLSRDCLRQRLERSAAVCGCSAEHAIRQVPLVAVYNSVCDALAAKSLKQVILRMMLGVVCACCTHAATQLVASNQSQVGSGTAEGVYMKVCNGDVIADRFKIVREGFIAGDGGRHWMHSHVGGTRARNAVLLPMFDGANEDDAGEEVAGNAAS